MLATIGNQSLANYQACPMDQNPAAVYLASLSPKARDTMLQALNDIAAMIGTPEIYQEAIDKRGKPTQKNMTCFYCNWGELRYQHTSAIRAQLAERNQAATVNKKLCALRGVLKAAWLLGMMSAEDYHKARNVESVTGETIPAGRSLQPGEIGALIAGCEQDSTPAGARDASIIALMYGAGLRRDEIAKLSLDDFDNQTGALKVLHGKRNKQRTAYLTNGALAAMNDWLVVRGNEPGPLYIPINKGGKLINRRLTNQTIYNMLQKRGEMAGVRNLSPHDFRRTFVGDLLDAGADIAIVAKMAGHASVTTTSRYDRRPEQAKQRAAGLLHVPYHGRQN